MNACRKKERSSETLPAEGIGYIPVTRGHREGSVNAPCAIEYILVTRWRGGKKGGQNRVCACDTTGRSRQQKVVNLNIRVKQFALPESGERKRNLTTLVLVKRAAVKRSRSRQKVSESSQNPLKWSCTAKSTRQGRSSEPPPSKT